MDKSHFHANIVVGLVLKYKLLLKELKEPCWRRTPDILGISSVIGRYL